jgi:hypothetical protein
MSQILPQDIYLLSNKWNEKINTSRDEKIGPISWRKEYELHLENSIARWLANGLITYQESELRNKAFKPISYLIGTSRESISYLDSFEDISNGLKNKEDQFYKPHPDEKYSQNPLLLGEFFSRGVSKAEEIISHRLIEDKFNKRHCFSALADSLMLIQIIKPENAKDSLYKSWFYLNGKSKNKFDEVKALHPWLIEHAFVLACYPYCKSPSKEIERVITGLESEINNNPSAPEILKSDLNACRTEISK